MNHLAFEPLLLDKLTSIEGIKYIVPSADFDTASVSPELLPSLYVYYVDELINANEGKLFNYVTQKWCVLVAVKNLKKQNLEQRQTLGNIITSILTLLQGWEPGGDFGFAKLQRVDAPGPTYKTGGLVYFPLYFIIDFPVLGDSK